MMEEKFALNQRVKITELETTGKVIGIYKSVFGVRYDVRYFDKAEAKSVYFFEDELTPAE